MDGLILLREAHDAGLTISKEGNTLKVMGPRGEEALAKRLISNKAAVFDAFRETRDTTVRTVRHLAEASRSAVDRYHPPCKPEELSCWKTKFSWLSDVIPDDLPAEPFVLHAGVSVVGAEQFLLALRREVEKGPNAPRALTGALQEDCKRIKTILRERKSLYREKG